MGAINNCTAKVFQNGIEVMTLTKVSIITYNAPIFPAPVVQPSDTCEVYGDILSVKYNEIILKDQLDIKFESQRGDRIEGWFYFKLPSAFNIGDTVYLELSGALTLAE